MNKTFKAGQLALNVFKKHHKKIHSLKWIPYSKSRYARLDRNCCLQRSASLY